MIINDAFGVNDCPITSMVKDSMDKRQSQQENSQWNDGVNGANGTGQRLENCQRGGSEWKLNTSKEPAMEDESARPGQDERERRTNAARDMRWGIERAVTRYATDLGEELRERPAWPGAASTVHEADPATGIRAAVIARNSAERVRNDYIRRAREDGMTWQAIGAALGLDEGRDAPQGYELGVAAYEEVAGPPNISWQPTIGYTCPSCTQTITDRGPYENHPEDNEHGHADGCERLAADVAAHRQRQVQWDAEFEAGR